MRITKQPLTVIAFSSLALGIIVCLAILSSGAMLFLSEAYPRAVSAVLIALILMGAAAIVIDVGVVLRTVRQWSWRNALLLGLTTVNFGLTVVLVFYSATSRSRLQEQVRLSPQQRRRSPCVTTKANPPSIDSGCSRNPAPFQGCPWQFILPFSKRQDSR